MRIILPGSEVELTLQRGETVLIGRDPDLAAAHARGTRGSVRTFSLAVPGISANHLLVRYDEDGVHATDLKSRNGSWVRLPALTDVGLGSSEISVRLAPVTHEMTTPPRARWSSGDDFPSGIAEAVRSWFAQLGEEADVAIASPANHRTVTEFDAEIPLRDERVLRIRPRRTVEASWAQRIESLWRFVEAERRTLAAEEAARDEGMVLASPSIREAHQRVIDAAVRRRRLVLLGPTGVGKEELARVFHRNAGRGGPFVALNCAQLDRELIRAELFGAEQGAYTGSVRKLVGAVEHANGGTLFLDEVGELPLEVQPMLLRFLDRGEYTRLGSYDRNRTSDVLVVCATNRDLRTRALDGTFRLDLWFRLAMEVVEIDGLEHRWDDVAAYLERHVIAGARSLLAAMPADALDVLRRHSWPGNFRELANFIARLPASASGIDAAECRRALERGGVTAIAETRPRETPDAADTTDWTSWWESSLRAFEEDHGGRRPGRWDEVQELVERYLKPFLMVRIGNVGPTARDPSLLAKQARRIADALAADRGTALKQLTRYVERFTD